MRAYLFVRRSNRVNAQIRRPAYLLHSRRMPREKNLHESLPRFPGALSEELLGFAERFLCFFSKEEFGTMRFDSST
jgi:hypothetical protein